MEHGDADISGKAPPGSAYDDVGAQLAAMAAAGHNGAAAGGVGGMLGSPAQNWAALQHVPVPAGVAPISSSGDGAGNDEMGNATDSPSRDVKAVDGAAPARGTKRRLGEHQETVLKSYFAECRVLKKERKDEIVANTGLEPRQVEVWFQNRRARTKIKNNIADFDSLKAENGRLRLEVEALRHRAEAAENALRLAVVSTGGFPSLFSLGSGAGPPQTAQPLMPAPTGAASGSGAAILSRLGNPQGSGGGGFPGTGGGYPGAGSLGMGGMGGGMGSGMPGSPGRGPSGSGFSPFVGGPGDTSGGVYMQLLAQHQQQHQQQQMMQQELLIHQHRQQEMHHHQQQQQQQHMAAAAAMGIQPGSSPGQQ